MKTIQKLLLCLVAIWLSSSPILAAPLDNARDAFESGDYKKAGKLATKAAKKLKDKSEKAEALVIAGASAFKLGKNGKSKFKKALKLDSNVTLPASAESDAKIAKAFASAQKSGTKASSGGGGSSSDSLTRSASSVNKSPSNVKNFIPFGVNNFLQGKTLTAVATAGMQVGGLFLFLNRKDAAAAADKDAQSVIDDAESSGATEEEEFQQFLTDNDAFVKKANSEATLALLLAGGGYAISVIDALFDPLGTARTASNDSTKVETYANIGSDFEGRKIDSSWKFDLRLMPSREPSLMLTAKQSF